MLAFLSDLVISIVVTLVISRLLLWITKGWTDSLVRLVVAHAASLVLCVVLGTWVLAGIADSPSDGALALFAPGQLAWLLVDLLRRVLRQRQVGK
jgi:hypothetical protein